MSKENFKDVETIIGPSVRVEGEFKADGNVIIEGQVIGGFKTKKNLRAGEGSKIKANIEAENAWIAGEVKGNLIIKNHLELSPNAKIKGNIEAQILTMETGAQITGNIKMGDIQHETKTEIEK
ncbi:polymer-forming cytoskeletal protein [Patescibacteria group bacterium]|nr:polymer-forming cytoskeletal protein [Patescibacteria group bacterium]MBU4482133.1 polymer-forming cytoskeletal protein [Patescibacteria group bacterium]